MNEPKRLYRSRSQRMIAGVCGGLAEYFNLDPTLVRVLLVASVLLWGGGLLLYLVMMFVVPEAPVQPKAEPGGKA
jgi:phage shock protein C